jgi:hypothetical protein
VQEPGHKAAALSCRSSAGRLPSSSRLCFRQGTAVSGQEKIAEAKRHDSAGAVSTWPVFTEIIEDLGQAQNERNLLARSEPCVLQDQDFARRLEQQLNAGSLIPHNFTHVI